jgi:hypothetical protein
MAGGLAVGTSIYGKIKTCSKPPTSIRESMKHTSQCSSKIPGLFPPTPGFGPVFYGGFNACIALLAAAPRKRAAPSRKSHGSMNGIQNEQLLPMV